MNVMSKRETSLGLPSATQERLPIWIAKMRHCIALFGSASPLATYAERRLAAATRPLSTDLSTD